MGFSWLITSMCKEGIARDRTALASLGFEAVQLCEADVSNDESLNPRLPCIVLLRNNCLIVMLCNAYRLQVGMCRYKFWSLVRKACQPT